MKILMIYESIPDETCLYLIDTGNNKQFAEAILDCHGKFVNCTDDFDGDAAIRAMDVGTRIYCSSDEEVSPMVMPQGVSRIVVTGIYL